MPHGSTDCLYDKRAKPVIFRNLLNFQAFWPNGFGYNHFGAVGGSGIVGTILLVIQILWQPGALGTRV